MAVCSQTLLVIPIALKLFSWRFCTVPFQNLQSDLVLTTPGTQQISFFVDLNCSDVPVILVRRQLLTDSHHTEHQLSVEKSLYYHLLDLMVTCKKSLLATTEKPPHKSSTVKFTTLPTTTNTTELPTTATTPLATTTTTTITESMTSTTTRSTTTVRQTTTKSRCGVSMLCVAYCFICLTYFF